MKWFNIFKKKKPVDRAIDDLEVIADKYDLDEHDWSSVDDASDYLYEHKVKKVSWEDKLKPIEAELEDPLGGWEPLEHARRPKHPIMDTMMENYRKRSRKPLRRRKD